MKPFKLIWIMAMLMSIGINDQGHAFQIEIKDNKISAAADKVPLQDLLKKIAADYGIKLLMDPNINPPITASFQNRKLEDGLRSILRPHNYVLYWKTNKTTAAPSAPAYQLDQIQVFKPGEKEKMVDIGRNSPPLQPPSSEPLDLPITQESPQTDVIVKGNKVFVPVTLVYQDREVQTTLLFDTGASSIVLHENVAEELEIDEYQSSQGRGVGGVRISTRTTNLTHVEVGPNRKENLRVDIIEYQGPEDEDYNGLLGMNFLRGLKYTIDFENQTIQWMP